MEWQMEEGEEVTREFLLMAKKKIGRMYTPRPEVASRIRLDNKHAGMPYAQVVKRIESNMYKVCFLKDGSAVSGVWGTFIRERTMLTVAHAFFDSKGERRDGILMLTDESKTTPFADRSLYTVRRDRIRDIAIVEFSPGAIRAHRDIMSLFPLQHKVTPGIAYDGTYVLKGFDYKKMRITGPRYHHVKGESTVGRFDGDVRGARMRFYSRTVDMGMGSCGALLVSSHNGTFYVCAMHQSGSPYDTINAGTFLDYSLMYPPPVLADLMKPLEVDTTVKDLGPVPDVKWLNIVPQHAYHLHNELPSHVTFIGAINHSSGTNTKSRFYTTPMCDQVPGLPPNEYTAPNTKIYTDRTTDPPTYHCHLTTAMTQMCDVGQFTQAEVEPAAETLYTWLEKQYLSVAPRNKLTPLTLDAALNGIDGLPFFDGVKASTSMGFPGFGTKDQFIPQDEITGRRKMTAPCLAAYKRYILSLARGRPPATLINLTLKDTKVKNDKVRAFANCPFFHNLTLKILFGPLLNLMHLHPTVFGNAVGMNARSDDWKSIRDQLAKRSYQLHFDHSKFDKKMCFMINAFVWMILLRLLSRFYDMGSTIFGVPIMVLAHNIAKVSINPLYVLRSVVYLIRASNPSGNAITVDWNFFANLLYMILAFQSDPRSEGVDFFDVITAWIYGDDNNSGTDVEWYDLIFFANYMAEHNLKVTMATKGAELTRFQTMSEQSFLKRRFAEWGGVVHCPIAMDTIAAMINCAMRTEFVLATEVEKSNIAEALEMLAEWEPTPEILALDANIRHTAVRVHGPTFVFPSRQETLDRWLPSYPNQVLSTGVSPVEVKNGSGSSTVMQVTDTELSEAPSLQSQSARNSESMLILVDQSWTLKANGQTETNSTEATNGAIPIHASEDASPPRSMAEPMQAEVGQPEVTKIETIAPVATLDMPSASVESMLSPSPVDAGLESYLARPVLLQEFVWNADINVKFDPWALLLNQTRVRNKLQGYKYM